MTVQNIDEFLCSKYPPQTACDFDNVGLLVGDKDSDVKQALVTLDCDLTAVDVAIEQNCQLIITHHPVIFNALKNVLSESVVFKLIKAGIAVISMHTNLDIGKDGVNDCLCRALELDGIEELVAHDGYLLKKGNISALSPDKFAVHIKTKLGGNVRYVTGKNDIERVVVCSGSGGDFLEDAVSDGCDAFVTADVKHSVFLQAKDLGISLFDGGHFHTEDIVIEPLKNLLQDQFKDISFITSHYNGIKLI